MVQNNQISRRKYRSFVRLHYSLICLLRFARFTCAVCCAHSLSISRESECFDVSKRPGFVPQWSPAGLIQRSVGECAEMPEVKSTTLGDGDFPSSRLRKGTRMPSRECLFRRRALGGGSAGAVTMNSATTSHYCLILYPFISSRA